MCENAETEPVATVEGYRFHECGACGFVFAPRITRAHLEHLYSDGFHGPEEGAPEEGWALTEPDFLDVGLERLPKARPLHILDFGTGQSRTPDWLRARGHRTLAIDVAPPVRPHPDRLVGDLLDAHFPDATFDLSYAFQVFEHLPDPRLYLDELLRVTRPGGLVLVHTDMEVPERAQGLDQWWYVLPPDHCAFYRHRTFERYLEGTPHRISHRDPKRVLITRG